MSFIVIQQYQFPIRDPYYRDHPMTDVEANVLNWHRARLIQKIVRVWVLEAINKSPHSILSVAEANELSNRIIEFDRTYEISPAKEPRTSVLEYNLDLLAQNFLRRNGALEIREEDLERIKKTPEIQERARDLINSSKLSLAELMT